MIKEIVKKIVKYPINILNYFVVYLYYRFARLNHMVQNDMFESGGRKILIIAPHVDDETIGLGATLGVHAKGGDEIYCVYVTDGSASLSEISKNEIISERKKEARVIQELIGIKEIFFLDFPDGKVTQSNLLQEKLLGKLKHINPDIIYSPFLIDAHNDHVETTRNLLHALHLWKNDFKNLYMYETNCPILACLVNSVAIFSKEAYNEKVLMMNEFKTQSVMLLDAFLLLNRMKSLLVNDGYCAETFVKTDVGTAMKISFKLDYMGFSPLQFRQLSNRYNLLLGFLTGYVRKIEYSKEVKKML